MCDKVTMCPKQPWRFQKFAAALGKEKNKISIIKFFYPAMLDQHSKNKNCWHSSPAEGMNFLYLNSGFFNTIIMYTVYTTGIRKF